MGKQRLEREMEGVLRRLEPVIAKAVARVAGARQDRIFEEVAQKVRISVWKALKDGRGVRNLSAYVWRSAVREAVREIEKLSSSATALEENSNWVSTEPSPEDHMAHAELREMVLKALEELPANRARAVKAHLMGFSLRETMQMYGWTYNKARNLLFRGLRDLRSKLRERGVRYGG